MVKNPLANASDMSLIPGLERSLGEGNGNSFQYFFLGNPMHRGVCQATVNGVSKDYVESIHRSQRYHIIRPNESNTWDRVLLCCIEIRCHEHYT